LNSSIIKPNRYKKISKKNKIKKDLSISKNIIKNRNRKYKDENNNYMYKLNNRKKVKRSNNLLKLIKSLGLVIIIVCISYLSRFFVDIENNPIIAVFMNNKNNVKLVSNYDFKIGINSLNKEKNVLINELKKYSDYSLIKYNDNYTFEYKNIKNIKKINDLEYEIELKNNENIDNIINEIKSNIKDIDNVTKNNNFINIKIKTINPYFIYYLNFSLKNINNNQNNFNYDNDLKFVRNDKVNNNILKSVTFQNFTSSDLMIESFRNNNIDMFLTSSMEDMRLIGKHEYSIKKYRDGETYFILGNKLSNLFSKIEVRKAIAYSLNRNEIAKKVNLSFTEVIDIPYIYSDVRFKYDIYGAENGLIANGWVKRSGIYVKDNIALELNLLVNVNDNIKCIIADNMQDDLNKVGIKLNIHKLQDNEINDRMNSNNYDIVLSKININENPDISYIYNYININDVVNEKIINLQNSSIDNIPDNINVLMNTISEQVACIGILSKNVNVVYQKYIVGIGNINYLNIFKNIEEIGKVLN
jgi:ABC-type oligopeptide transport system substrate-binding subunit